MEEFYSKQPIDYIIVFSLGYKAVSPEIHEALPPIEFEEHRNIFEF